MNFDIKKLDPDVKEVIENYIDLINNNKFEELFGEALINEELNEDQFTQLCETLREIDIPIDHYRDEFFLNLFSQYMENYADEYEPRDSDRFIEMMNTMSTAGCLGLELNEIILLLKSWDAQHPNKIEFYGDSLDTFRIKFL